MRVGLREGMERPKEDLWEEVEVLSRIWKHPLPTQLCGLSLQGRVACGEDFQSLGELRQVAIQKSRTPFHI